MNIAEKKQIMSANNVTIAENQQKVFDAGKKAEQNAFWDEFLQWDASTQQSTRTSYTNGFYGGGWTSKNFKPTHTIKVKSGAWMFQLSQIDTIEEGILDLSECTNAQSMFTNSAFTKLPILDISSVKTDTTKTENYLKSMFSGATQLKTITKLKLGSNQQFPSMFANCKALQNITFEGVIGRDIDFSACPLSVESMINVITHLANYKDTENQYIYTVKFSESCWEALENSDYDVTEYNTSVACWQDYCGYKGWNT